MLHPPPYGTELDQAPAIDAEFRVQTEDVAHEDRAGRLDRGARLHRRGAAAAQPPRARARVAGGAAARAHAVHQPRVRVHGRLAGCAIVTMTDGAPEYQFTSG